MHLPPKDPNGLTINPKNTISDSSDDVDNVIAPALNRDIVCGLEMSKFALGV